MMIGVSFYLYDQSVLIKVVISIGAIPTSIGIILFAINVLIGMKNKKVLNSV